MNRTLSARFAFVAVALASTAAVAITLLATGRIPVPDPADAIPVADAASEVDYLFTQGFTSGTLTGPNDSNLTLTLSGLRDYVTVFTDRPNRQANLLSDPDFYELWDEWFEADPPNAVLSYTPDGLDRPVGVVVKLMNPRYFPDAGVVTYQAVKIPKSEALIPGAEMVVTPAANDPNVQNHIGSFGAGMLFIDDAAAAPITFTGFFNASSVPAVNTKLSNLVVTPSLKLATVTVTGSANGTLAGSFMGAFGAPGATAGILSSGTFVWSGPNDWTLTFSPMPLMGPAPTLAGTMTDAGGTIAGSLTMKAVVGAAQTPVTLDLAYDGVGNFAGHAPTSDFTIAASTFSGVVASFTTADPALALAGKMTTALPKLTTESVTSPFSGTVTAGRYAFEILPVFPAGIGPVTLTGGTTGLSGSVTSTDLVIGGTKYPSLTLTYDTSRPAAAGSGTIETNLGILSARFDLYRETLSNIALSGQNLQYGPGLTIGSLSLTAPTGTTGDTACSGTGRTSFLGNAGGAMTIKGKNSASFANPLAFTCGRFESATFKLTVVHSTSIGVANLTGSLYFSAAGGAISPCPISTSPVNGGCGTTVPYLGTTLTSAGPAFYGSVAYRPSVASTFSFLIDATTYTATANVYGPMGMGIAVYTDATGAWKDATAVGGRLATQVAFLVNGVKTTGGGNGRSTCTFNTASDDYTCTIAFPVKATPYGSATTYTTNFLDNGSF